MITYGLPEIIDDNTILLTQNGKKLLLVMESNAKVKSRTWTTLPTKGYYQSNIGTSFVGFEIIIPSNSAQLINTYLIPGGEKIGYFKQISLFETE